MGSRGRLEKAADFHLLLFLHHTQTGLYQTKASYIGIYRFLPSHLTSVLLASGP